MTIIETIKTRKSCRTFSNCGRLYFITTIYQWTSIVATNFTQWVSKITQSPFFCDGKGITTGKSLRPEILAAFRFYRHL